MTEKVKRKVFVFVAFMVMMVFESIPDKRLPQPEDLPPNFHDFFLLYDLKITWQTWFYSLCFQIGFMMYAYLVWMLDKENRKYMRAVFYVTIFYVIEYVLHYSSTWYKTEYIDISSHLFTVSYLGYLLNKNE